MSYFLQQLVNGLQLGSVYALIALGYTMVYGVLRLINFAHGDVFMVGAFVGFFLAEALKINKPQPSVLAAVVAILPVLLLTMIICAVLGLIIERLAYRPLRRAPRLTALITAIGVSLLLVNGGQLIFGADPQFFSMIPSDASQTLNVAGVTISLAQLWLVGASAFLMGLLWFIVNKTKVGQAMRAVSHDADAASLMGINTDVIIAVTFALGAALAGGGGVLFASLTSAKILPTIGVRMGLKAFVAAVVGGIGSVPGAMLGGLLMGLSESFIKGAPKIGTFEPSRWSEAAAFILLIAVLLFKPAGLLGSSAPEKV